MIGDYFINPDLAIQDFIVISFCSSLVSFYFMLLDYFRQEFSLQFEKYPSELRIMFMF
jgi:hypothetical protein